MKCKRYHNRGQQTSLGVVTINYSACVGIEIVDSKGQRHPDNYTHTPDSYHVIHKHACCIKLALV